MIVVNMRYVGSFFIFFLMCLSAFTCEAQTDTCILHLKEANNKYEQGNFDDAIILLKNTIAHCPLGKDDEIQASKLLILCYQNIDDLEAADRTAKAVLKIDPNYRPDKFKDDAALIRLFDRYQPQPTFAIGLGAGINSPLVKTINQYSVVHPDGDAQATYKGRYNLQLGLHVEKRIYKGLWAELAYQYRITKYDHELADVNNTTIDYSEKLNYSDVPLSLKYYFTTTTIMPYVQLGAEASLLSSALSTTTREDQKDIINRTALRNKFSIGFLGAAGAAYRLKALLLFANLRYTYFPRNVNKSGTRYDDPINLYKYYYIDDDFRMDNLQLNVGVSLILSYKNMRIGKAK